MRPNQQYNGGENFDLRDILLAGRAHRLNKRVSEFAQFLHGLSSHEEFLCMRPVASVSDRTVLVEDSSGQLHEMLMFGSNNYLGLANHPHVREKVAEGLAKFGTGVGGPPLLNGYTTIHRELERRLAAFKCTEDAMIFSTGYGANVGLISALATRHDTILYDAYSHASFADGLKMCQARSYQFPHNDMQALEENLESHPNLQGDTFIGVEGVYSMDGDTAPLSFIASRAKAAGAILIVDDAHGTGVMGATGRGTSEHFGVESMIPLTVGTFSKVFAATGGFVAGPKAIIDYLRFFARSYMFSASLPPAIIAGILGGLDVIEREPEHLVRLRANCAYLAAGLRSLGFAADSPSAIFPLRTPPGMNMRAAGMTFHRMGIFLNSVEYPAVPASQQRFRISVMASHTREDIDRLLDAIAAVWRLHCTAEAVTLRQQQFEQAL